MGVSLDERHKARLERMMMEEEEEVKGLEVSEINISVVVVVVVVMMMVIVTVVIFISSSKLSQC